MNTPYNLNLMYERRSKSNGIVSISQNANEIQIFLNKICKFLEICDFFFCKISLRYLLLPLTYRNDKMTKFPCRRWVKNAS